MLDLFVRASEEQLFEPGNVVPGSGDLGSKQGDKLAVSVVALPTSRCLKL